MKYLYLITFLICVSFSTQAQQPIDKEVGSFHTVKVFDLIHISLTPSSENKVIISGEDTDDVEVINKNGILKIRMKLDRSFDGTHTFVAVHYKNISTIDANEGAKIIGSELIKQDALTLKSQEGGQIKVGLDVDYLDVRAVTGGVIETSGIAKRQEISINTGGAYLGDKLETKTTKVQVKAGGEADVNASDTVDAKVLAGGDILIYGNPKTVNKSKTFGGSIKRAKQQQN